MKAFTSPRLETQNTIPLFSYFPHHWLHNIHHGSDGSPHMRRTTNHHHDGKNNVVITLLQSTCWYSYLLLDCPITDSKPDPYLYQQSTQQPCKAVQEPLLQSYDRVIISLKRPDGLEIELFCSFSFRYCCNWTLLL